MHWCGQGGHKHRVTHPAALHRVARSSPHHRSRSQSPQGPHHSVHEGYSDRLQKGTSRRMELARGPRESGQGRVGQDSPPWQWGPKAPGAQSSQAVPANPEWHLHCPLPLMPSMHTPWSLQGWLAPPGQARGWSRSEVGSGTLLRTAPVPHRQPQPSHTVHPPPSGSPGSSRCSNPPESPCCREQSRAPRTPHRVLYRLHTPPTSWSVLS